MREALVTVSVAVSGALVCHALSRENASWRRLAAAVALGPFVGFGLVSLTGFCLISMGLGLEAAVPTCWVGALVAALAMRRRDPLVADRAASTRPTLSRVLVAVLLLSPGLVAITSLASRMARERPAGEWDAVAMWNARARLLARSEAGAPEAIRRLERGQPAYPLFLPMANAAQMAIVGRESVRTPFFTGLAIYLGLLATFGFLVPRASRWPATAALATTPAVAFWGLSQGADTALASGILIGILGCSGAPENAGSSSVPPIVAGFALGLLPFVKDEGWLYAGVGVTLALWPGRTQSPARWRERFGAGSLLIGTLPGLFAAVGFKLYWVGAARSAEFASRLRYRGWADPEAWLSVVAEYLTHLLDWGPSRWSWAWPALALLVVLGSVARMRSTVPMTVALWVVLAAVFSWAIFFPVSPFGTQTHLRQALERLLLQAFPLLVALALWRIELARKREGAREAMRSHEVPAS